MHAACPQKHIAKVGPWSSGNFALTMKDKTSNGVDVLPGYQFVINPSAFVAVELEKRESPEHGVYQVFDEMENQGERSITLISSSGFPLRRNSI